MGEQFVAGQTIDEALDNSRSWVARGFRYSYDMLGEAAVTMAQAERYFVDYTQAIRAIGGASAGRGILGGPGISVKLSALHPRYSRSQIERVQAELYPRLKALAVLAREVDIGLNIDAEEADRLELSLDLLERLCHEPELAGWHGIGFVVQAYQKRCPFVIDWLIDLAHRSGHRLDGAAWSRAPIGTARSSAPSSTGWRAFRSSREGSTPTSATSPARRSCCRPPIWSIRSSPPTTR
jgi:RHH-type proline utilization regulon transcriptional repressor/proline dehydrogenase/delta 1-pyrroline-5-carboxylate dehydrogenase